MIRHFSRDVLGDEAKRELNESSGKFARYVVAVVAMCALLVSILGYMTGEYIIALKREGLDEQYYARTQVVAQGKAQTLSTWFDQAAKVGFQITRFRVVQKFADFTFNMPQNQAVPADQARVIGDILDEFVYQNQLVGAFLTTPRGTVLVASSDIGEYSEYMASDAFESSQKRGVFYGGVRFSGSTLVADIYQPIYPNLESNKPVAVLGIFMPVKPMINAFLTPDPVSGKHENIELFQLPKNGGLSLIKGGSEIGVYPWGDTFLRQTFRYEWRLYAGKEGVQSLSRKPTFGLPASIPRASDVLVAKAQAAGTPFIVLNKMDMLEAYKPILSFRTYVHIITQLSVFVILLIGLAAWWWQKQYKNRALLKKYHDLTRELAEQENLLSSINNSVKEYISLKSLSGHYMYVNPAFAFALGMPSEKVQGLKDKDVFKIEDAERLEKLDLKAFTDGRVEKTLTLNMEGEARTVEVAKSLVRDHQGSKSGLVCVLRDVTDVARERGLRENALRNSIEALLRMVERHDTYLARHARYTVRVVRALGEKMKYGTEDMTTLDVAAHLYLVGKVFVPVDILRKKQDARTPEEKAIFEAHIEHAGYILDSIDWELPVLLTVYHMFERLDGSGYPNQLKGDDICTLARVMAVCDTFCRLIAPRSGEEHMTPEEAIQYFRTHKEAYDLRVVEKLTELILEDSSVLLAA